MATLYTDDFNVVEVSVQPFWLCYWVRSRRPG